MFLQKLKSMKKKKPPKKTRSQLINDKWIAGEFKTRKVKCKSHEMGDPYKVGHEYTVCVSLMATHKVQMYLSDKHHRNPHGKIPVAKNSHRVFDNIDHLLDHFTAKKSVEQGMKRNYAYLVDIDTQLQIKE